jgi:hypothetical protein
MREVLVRVKCDRCANTFDVENGADGVQQSVPLTFNKDVVEVDLCTPCVEILENDLATLLAHGRRLQPLPRAKRKSSPAVGTACPECAEQGVRRVIETPQGFAVHRFRTHGVKGTSKDAVRKRTKARG